MRITRTLAAGLALALCAPTVGADGDRDRGGSAAQNRSGGSSSSGSSASAAGARHHSGGGGGGSATAHPGGGGGNPSGGNRAYPRGGGVAPGTGGAAMRHPRAGTGTGWYRGGHYGGYYGGYYPYYGWGYWGYPYYGWYGDWAWGWGWGGYAWSTPYYRTGYYSTSGYKPAGSMRVIVKPSKTRVYVDGYYSGTADDFDGMFQRLDLVAGRHEIAFKLEGYRTHRVQVWVEADETLKLRHEMVAGEGESAEDRVPPEAVLREREEKEELERIKREPHREREVAPVPRAESEVPALAAGSAPAGTAVVLDVEPADASVYVDGEFRGTVGELRQVWLAPGKHRLEIVRPGFVTLDREIEVGTEAVPLNLRLEKR